MYIFIFFSHLPSLYFFLGVLLRYYQPAVMTFHMMICNMPFQVKHILFEFNLFSQSLPAHATHMTHVPHVPVSSKRKGDRT